MVSTAPANGTTGPAPAALTIDFQRDITPAGTDYASSVTIRLGATAVAGTTAEPTPGVLTWTPAAALAPGTYQVTIDNVASALASGSVPIRNPYLFAFTVT